MQAKLHVALELGDSTGDKGFSLVGQGPPATGEKPDNSIELSRSVPAAPLVQPSRPAKNTTSASEEDVRLQHSAAQVWHPPSPVRMLGFACISARFIGAGLRHETTCRTDRLRQVAGLQGHCITFSCKKSCEG